MLRRKKQRSKAAETTNAQAGTAGTATSRAVSNATTDKPHRHAHVGVTAATSQASPASQASTSLASQGLQAAQAAQAAQTAAAGAAAGPPALLPRAPAALPPAPTAKADANTAGLRPSCPSPQHLASDAAAAHLQLRPQPSRILPNPSMPPTSIPSNPPTAANSGSINQKQVRKAQSWYGHWPKTPKKASASLSVARENIQGGTVRSSAVPDLGRFDSVKRKVSDTASSRGSLRSISLAKVPEDGGASLGMMTSDGLVDNIPHGRRQDITKSDDSLESRNDVAVADPENASQDPALPDQSHSTPTDSTPTAQEPAASPGGWFGWWSKAPPAMDQQTTNKSAKSDDAAKQTTEHSRPVTPPAQVATPEPMPREPPSAASSPASASAPLLPPPPPPPTSSSWFGFWSSSNASMKQAGIEKDGKSEAGKNKQEEDVVMQDAPQETKNTPKTSEQPATTPKAGSTWVFWGRASPSTASTKDPASPDSGEMAIMGEGSEAQPTRIKEGDVSGPPSKDLRSDNSSSKSAQPETKSTWRKKKRVRPPSLDAVGDSDASTGAGSTTTTIQEPQGLPRPPTREKKSAVPSTTKVESSRNSIEECEMGSKQPPNLLLPSFSSTYQMKENPSILQQIAQFLLRTSQPPANHVFRANDVPKIRKAIAIGVHGLFPATYLRPMIGQPTGTSLRFANLCAEAIRRWTDAHGSPDCEIEKVALEGEGRISDRVDNLWRLMLNWIDHIRNADLIIMACHSQGVPVSIMLLEKLIDLGIITDAKIGVCAMAGVSMGPFPEYKSSILMGSAAELWEFGNPQSANSQRFEASLKRVLDYGARVTFIGSIDDQVVPMESAVYSPASHPYIYRAVFIDGRIHAPDFIAHLVGFALKLRNLGVTDHGLVRELSIALAGSLYSGEGHSRLYYDPAVYDLAICHALETTSTPSPIPCEVAPREGLSSTNPYVLPWIMRGMLEEDFVKTELSSETEELLRQFDDWKPSSKALKDVKYRLEAVRSKL
ncbi:hypothetical protein E4U54_003635 [Claviceps lovelessii]|nr:hypothetical protein E4U54_003635 [Claviceps lovelessii]